MVGANGLYLSPGRDGFPRRWNVARLHARPEEFGGQDLYNTWTYTKIAPMQRIEYILKFTDKDGKAFDPAEMGFPAGIPKEVRNVNIFKDLGSGKTELTITEYGYTSARRTIYPKPA